MNMKSDLKGVILWGGDKSSCRNVTEKWKVNVSITLYTTENLWGNLESISADFPEVDLIYDE